MRTIFLSLLATSLVCLLWPFNRACFSEPSGKLVIYHAGSLSVPFARIEREFEARYPKVDVLREMGGSTRMARLIRDVGKPADIMASADYTVIDELLIPGFATWNIRFASNQLVLCYTNKSRYASIINSENWYEILLKRDVAWGHADPDIDPCGYRSLMVMQLAEKFYKKPGLFKRLMASRSKSHVRPKSVELISLLQTGNLDYAWEYLSVAVQHGLKYVQLDDRINLGNEAYNQFYSQARVRVAGKRPGTWIIKRGRACTYGVTILNNAPNREAATAFLEYLLAPDGGLQILRQNGQPPIVPCEVGSRKVFGSLPPPIKKLVVIRESRR